MSEEFFRLCADLSARGEEFCTAVVMRADGSASARAGAKAVIAADGRVLQGYVGGGCAEATVAAEAAEALKDGLPRTVELSLTDELGATGMPCGGKMAILVEPHRAGARLLVLGHGRLAAAVARAGAAAGFHVTVDDPEGTPELYPHAARVVADNPDYARLEAGPNTWVVVATHHKSDHLAIRRALDLSAAGISMIASVKRRGVVFDMLSGLGATPAQLAAIRAPAGLDLGGSSPEEIALAVVAEIVAAQKGGSCRPLRQVKGG
jgi:xanthine dehydrogenase accessory factor